MEGQILAGRYELVERIGSGGMANVWHARDLTLNRDVAVKILHPHLAQDPSFAERFRREARNAAQLSHPGIVAIYDTGEEDGLAFIVMELVEGETLHEIIRQRGTLPVAETARIARHVLGAFGAAHAAGIVHRDGKPANILVTTSGEVKVTDFGIAKGLQDAAHLTQTGQLMGTASYLSPEQASGNPATPRSDLYALGCVLYECLTGAPPFRADSPVATAVQHQRAPVPSVRAHRPDVPVEFAAVIERALAKDPEARFSSAREMDDAIAQTRLDLAPDEAPTMAVPAESAPTAAVPYNLPDGTEVITPPQRRRGTRLGRLFRVAAIALLIAAAAWMGAFLLTTTQQDVPATEPTAEPTDAPTSAPAVVATAEPTAPSTPEPTPDPTPRDVPTPRTPTPPRTPDFDFNFFETPAPQSTP